MPRPLLAVLLLSFLSATARADKLDPKAVEFFEKRIRPVLVDNCYQCHSADAAKNKKLRGGLRLDTRDDLRKGGDSGAAIVSGKPKDSQLLKAMHHAGDLKMPPKGKLPGAVLADFAQWIAMGAPDPRDGATQTARTIDVDAGRKYWAFQPLKSTPPAVKNVARARTPVDAFILARLEEKNLEPNPAVNRERLIRRAYYDAWGLPPAPADVDAFLKDQAPDAYARLVDRLLQGQQFGERWARHWLDVVRFAESGGYEFDGDRPGAYNYRDFVIKAWSDDMPYDRFIRLQIAGDHLHPADYFATSATGFLVAGPYPGQTTSKTLQLIRYNHLDDMLSTLGSSMLGMSVGCARCHDHKYDPIPTKDYYRLLACLGRTDSTNAKLDPRPEIYRQAKAKFDQEHAAIFAAADKFEKEQLPARLQKWSTAAREQVKSPWIVLDLEPARPAKDAKPDPKPTQRLVARTFLKDLTAVRVETEADFKDLTVMLSPLDGKTKPAPVKLRRLPAPSRAGESSSPAGRTPVLFELEGAKGFDTGTQLAFTLDLASPPRISFSGEPKATGSPLAPAAPQSLAELHLLLQSDKGQLTPKNRPGVLHALRKLDPEAEKIFAPVEQANKKAPQPALVDVFAAQSGRGGDVHYLIRGEVDRQNGVAPPGFLQVATGPSIKQERWTKPEIRTEPRIALADWLTDTEQGAGLLLARVIVNRLWQHHMGRGIVATPNDFGLQGEPPTHPELLDFLAAELIKNGWKLKPIHKLIMTSGVYMQSGDTSALNLKVDPQNRLWWRHPARRLEAEAIRDAVIAVSSTLDPAMYGPGTLDANSPRRSIYLKVKRSQMIPMLQLFDIPEAIQSIGERTTSTVPTQSLTFLNSPFVRQRAEKFAQRIRPKSPEALPAAIEQAYLIALSRQPTSAERDRMLRFIHSQAQSYAPNAQASDLALTDFCQVLMCSNEFVYID